MNNQRKYSQHDKNKHTHIILENGIFISDVIHSIKLLCSKEKTNIIFIIKTEDDGQALETIVSKKIKLYTCVFTFIFVSIVSIPIYLPQADDIFFDFIL